MCAYKGQFLERASERLDSFAHARTHQTKAVLFHYVTPALAPYWIHAMHPGRRSTRSTRPRSLAWPGCGTAGGSVARPVGRRNFQWYRRPGGSRRHLVGPVIPAHRTLHVPLGLGLRIASVICTVVCKKVELRWRLCGSCGLAAAVAAVRCSDLERGPLRIVYSHIYTYIHILYRMY